MSFAETNLARALHRLIAGGCAALVLALGILAVSPIAHAELHEDADHVDHDCAIVLFTQGVALTLDFPAIPAPSESWHEIVAPSYAEIFLTTPRYLRHPERGPPQSLS